MNSQIASVKQYCNSLVEYSHRVRVTAVMPGATKTRSWAGAGLPDERFIRPEDIANAVFSAYALSANSVVEEIIIRPQEGDI